MGCGGGGGDEGLQQLSAAAASAIPTSALFPELCSPSPVQLTVWCKSLLFHGHGYTVYDSGGRVLFRVENYAHDWRQETVLMDNSGNVLITVRRRRKILSFMTENWEALEGDNYKATGGMIDLERGGGRRRRMRRRRVLFKARKDLGNSSCTVSMVINGDPPSSLGYRMSWSRQKEQFSINHIDAANTGLVAEMSRKYGTSPQRMHLLDKDVFTLSVQPGMDQAIVMAIVMITNSMR